jgi:hypothetical protein
LAFPNPAISLNLRFGRNKSVCPRNFDLKIFPILELKRRIGKTKGIMREFRDLKNKMNSKSIGVESLYIILTLSIILLF